ncbi:MULTISPECIES: RNA polymerase factor sigma-54 [Bacillaceae]|uniref:RNA polymerase factor sigma-54 n=1 Tax=Evansella alkalicola TaxID=745819 RepID=A0ABS6JUK0_9BACI|nr:MULTISPECIES: RNA polymerase factor sigma-54 [Bacillaceae]MBU9722226.1 RNA polymerase factor sigma-54 [Bacillus alkalicola]
MNMEYGLFQQQSMKLVMTNELRQAITILQYSVLDLKQYLHEQQLENPLMELNDNIIKEEIAREKYDFDYGYRKTRAGTSEPLDMDENDSLVEQLSRSEEGLQDVLLNQIRFLHLDPLMKRILTYLALNVDENGYLKSTSQEVAEEIKEPQESVEEALKILQSLEPYGVGATSLKECLLLQLKQLEVRDLLAEEIVRKHLDLLAKKQLKRIAKEEDVDIQEVQYVFDFIQTLNPKPGAIYQREPAKYIVPDVTVKKVNGEYIVYLNEDHLPEMTMNPRYKALMNNGESDVSQYMKQKYEQFQWIRRSVMQRQETLLKVAKAIVDYQKAFLEKGPTELRPMTLKMIGEMVGAHESTVSRATTKKYIQTPKGLYELKYFFKSNVGDSDGEDTSSERVKIYLKRLVDKENKQKPLSDQKLMTALKAKYGIQVSRRTVAKYREEMHILSSTQRKRYVE